MKQVLCDRLCCGRIKTTECVLVPYSIRPNHVYRQIYCCFPSSASPFLPLLYKYDVWTRRFTVLVQPRPAAIATSSCENWRSEFVPSVLYPLFFTQIYCCLYFNVSIVTTATLLLTVLTVLIAPTIQLQGTHRDVSCTRGRVMQQLTPTPQPYTQ